MPTNAIIPPQSLLISPEKSFELLAYAQQMASAFTNFGCSKPKRRKDTYALNVLQFVDVSASERGESSESSSGSDSVAESTVI